MVCDIHIFKEKLQNNKWVTADHWILDTQYENECFWELNNDHASLGSRHYGAFGIMAGVRSDGGYELQPKGFPEDAADETKLEYLKWDCYAHTPSYLTISELRDLQKVVETHVNPVSGFLPEDRLISLNNAVANGDENCWDNLYPYCEYTMMKGWVRFQIDVPLSYTIGDYIKNIIEVLETVGGDDQRIVFFFDN